jgi:hypothetical protein
MTCSVKNKLTLGLALMAIAVAFAAASAALAAEPNDDALVAAAQTPAATPKRELVSAPTDPKTEPALPRVATEPVKLERPPLRPRRVRRDDDAPRVREAAAGERRPRYLSGPIWHRNGGGGIGLVLGVGF